MNWIEAENDECSFIENIANSKCDLGKLDPYKAPKSLRHSKTLSFLPYSVRKLCSVKSKENGMFFEKVTVSSRIKLLLTPH